MAQDNIVKYQDCGCKVRESDCLISQGKTLCEDCNIDSRHNKITGRFQLHTFEVLSYLSLIFLEQKANA
jgi:hypothetical protein